nr:ABC transporter substrate-binding protein [Candidatus Njordarchaeum guaymaensis]
MKRILEIITSSSLIGTLLIGSLMIALSGIIALTAAQEIPRNETLQLSGYEGPPTALRPWDIGGQAGMAFFFMYEPLFGVNIAKGSAPADLIKILGESIQGLNSTTIEVKIRKEANWTDRQPITSADVEYSYGVYGLASDTKTWVAQEALPLKERLQSFEIVGNKTFRIHIKPEYPNSAVVWRHMTLSYNILPKHVWTQIEAQYGANMRTFTNDWQNVTMPSAWRVASGMYLPTWHDDDRTIMQRNENWWGQSVFGKLPAPKYILHTCYHYSNAPAALDLQNNEIDICGNFIPGIDTIMGSMPQIHTYDPNPPYYAETSIKLLVPNHRKYPLGEGWLHKAIAMALDYHSISLVSSGYLKYPSPYPSHLLPSDDAVAKALVRPEIEQQYAIYNNVSAAVAILEEHCIKGLDGRWYTKDGPSDEYLDLYTQWPENATWTKQMALAKVGAVDALTGEPGINVPLGPWSIMDQLGWSDVLAIDALGCSMIKNGLGITMTQKVVDWGTNDADGHSFNYDFMHFVMHSSTGTMYDRYYQMFVGTDYYWNHYGDYRNPELVELIRQLDITSGTAQQTVADNILTIIGTDMPIIPFGGHPNWYQYNTMYWTGFSNKATNKILPAGPFGGTATSGLMQTVVLGLSVRAPVTYSSIAVSKANVVPAELTTISVQAKNTGVAGTTTIQLLINGSVVDSQDISFAANATKTVSFNVSRTTLGTYLANIGGLTATFIVAQAAVVPAYIKGTVTDKDTGNAISGATVIAGSYQTTTATNGSYSLQVVTGTYIVAVIVEGYNPGNATVNAATGGQTYTNDMTLTALPSGEIPVWVYGVIALFVIIAVVALAYAFVFKKK